MVRSLCAAKRQPDHAKERGWRRHSESHPRDALIGVPLSAAPAGRQHRKTVPVTWRGDGSCSGNGWWSQGAFSWRSIFQFRSALGYHERVQVEVLLVAVVGEVEAVLEEIEEHLFHLILGGALGNRRNDVETR